MSYAAVVAANADDNQPLPDKGLLNTAEPSYDAVADDGSKVNVVAPDFKQHPETVTSQAREAIDEQVEINEKAAVAKDAAHEARVRKAPVHDETPESDDYYSIIKKYVARPGVAGGLLGIGEDAFRASVGSPFSDPFTFCSEHWPYRSSWSCILQPASPRQREDYRRLYCCRTRHLWC